MVQFVIDTRGNSVEVRSERSGEPLVARVFTRRWEALLLAGLLDESLASRGLDADTFQGMVRSRGQVKPLNRAQLQRLLACTQSFLDEVPDLKARIEAPPRKQTVGPWRLHRELPVNAVVDGRDGRLDWAHPALVRDDDTQALLTALSHLLVADAFAVDGRFLAAIDALRSVDRALLSDEGAGVVLLRLCSWYKHAGDFQTARACANEVLRLSCARDTGQASLARFFLLRIDYDQSPAANSDALWLSSAQEPAHPSGRAGDWRTLIEWHNLRALLARRRMHALVAEGPSCGHAVVEGVGAESVQSLHQLAIRHMQASIYLALWSRDWDRLQAYVANLAFHLQSTLLLEGRVEMTVAHVLHWHRLIMAYEDKFSAGRDSAWEYIFFAEFWLNHQPQVQEVPVPDPLAHNLGSFYPDQEAYYQRALERLRECGDDRQVAIGHSLYLRFAQEHLSPDEAELTIEQQTEQLMRLLGAQQDDVLLQNLIREGYAAHWPPVLLARKGVARERKIQRIQRRIPNRPMSAKKGT